MLKKSKKGFTIVELVIVIAVIGILSAILIPTFANLTTQAQQTALKSNLANAFSAYASEAADGKIDKTGNTIKFVEQNEVFLLDSSTITESTKGYVFEADGWNISEKKGAVSPMTLHLVTTVDVEEAKFNGFYVAYAE